MVKGFTKGKAQTFLRIWANLPSDSSREVETALSDEEEEALNRLVDQEIATLKSRYPEIVGDSSPQFIDNGKQLLQQAWTIRDLREREWLVYRIRDAFNQERLDVSHLSRFWEKDEFRDLPPKLTIFELVMFYFQKDLLSSALRCEGPNCATPYFFRAYPRDVCCSHECKTERHNKKKLERYYSHDKKVRSEKQMRNTKRGRPRLIRPEIV